MISTERAPLKTNGFKLDPEVKKTWVEALRSGNYYQGHEYLYQTVNDQKQFCCLGVYADLFLPESWIQEGEGPTCVFFKVIEEHHDQLLPHSILPGGIQEYLAGMNDEGYSFNEIADVIEESL